MTGEEAWRSRRNDRSMRYAGRTLDPTRRVVITVEQGYIETYSGQVALTTLANLLARMTPSVSVRLRDTAVLLPMLNAREGLQSVLGTLLEGADPFGQFDINPKAHGDYELHVGRDGARAVHGSGWNAYFGEGTSPLADPNSRNPFGPALAAILAGAHAFVRGLSDDRPEPTLVDTFSWSPAPTSVGPALDTDRSLGRVWVVGAGSVGTAVLYFTTLWTRAFHPFLFDRDTVKVENLDRSPTFLAGDVDVPKVEATARFLREMGLTDAVAEPVWLHESSRWANRPSGVPDLIVSTANEFGVRYKLEAGYPPLQIYGTTGRNWQASAIRHIPMREACSLCLFPEDAAWSEPTTCASASIDGAHGDGRVDASLPFLSFAAGLMAATEIAKSTLHGYPFGANRVCWSSKTGSFIEAAITPRGGCLCAGRDQTIHSAMVGR